MAYKKQYDKYLRTQSSKRNRVKIDSTLGTIDDNYVILRIMQTNWTFWRFLPSLFFACNCCQTWPGHIVLAGRKNSWSICDVMKFPLSKRKSEKTSDRVGLWVFWSVFQSQRTLRSVLGLAKIESTTSSSPEAGSIHLYTWDLKGSAPLSRPL